MNSFVEIFAQEKHWRSEYLPVEVTNLLGNLASKSVTRELASAMGMETPNVYAERETLTSVLDLAESASEMVLKPERASGSVGVRLLKHDSDGFLDIQTNERVEKGILFETLSAAMSRKRFKDLWRLEELLWSADDKNLPVDDIKFYCFHGVIELIVQRRLYQKNGRKAVSYQWYDSEWNVVDTGKFVDKWSDELRVPLRSDELLRVAAQVSKSVPTPFMRIDLYDSHRGVLLGELTPTPARPDLFNEYWQQRLADSWSAARKRLTKEINESSPTVEVWRRVWKSVHGLAKDSLLSSAEA